MTSMKPLIFATLALCWLAAPALAQLPQPNGAATVQPDLDPRGNLAGPHTNQTSGGESDNPAPHIYKRGEHISRGYGAFDDVMNWERFRLAKPPEGSHWVHFGDNYLLVKDQSGLITEIVKAS
jgi:Ni/Co efflux regulator RcnB